ncbi:hypothetical protein BH23GEM10_BH23GEM10_14210 [soil metagenome]
MRAGGHALLLALAMGVVGTDVHAQPARVGELLPARSLVRTPLADPHGSRIGTAVLVTNLLATQGPEREPFTLPDPEDSAVDVVAAVTLGVVLPLITLAEWESGAAVLVTEGKVFSRFRLEYEGRDDMGQDWMIGGGVEARDGRVSGRALFMHTSSHIGDEFALEAGAQRIEFGSEQLALFAAYDLSGASRVYGGLGWIFRSYLDWDDRLADLGVEDRATVQLGADGEWRPTDGGPARVYAGLDVQAAERTEWDAGWSLAAGIGIDTGSSGRIGRVLRIMLTVYDGPSTMGEFFLTQERYYGLEVNATL